MTMNIRGVINIRYAQIRSLDLSNGEGVGIALFVQGCPFKPHCKNCFNPETWNFADGKEWTSEIEDKFIKLASRPYIERISILGGEPLANENLNAVFNLINKISLSLPNKTIWLYTGFTWEDILSEDNRFLEYHETMRKAIVAQCDVLIDGRYIESQRNITLPYRGSSNQRVINVQKTLQQGEIALWCN